MIRKKRELEMRLIKNGRGTRKTKYMSARGNKEVGNRGLKINMGSAKNYKLDQLQCHNYLGVIVILLVLGRIEAVDRDLQIMNIRN